MVYAVLFFGGGAGIGSYVDPFSQSGTDAQRDMLLQAFDACVDKAEIAISVAKQHGDEMLRLETELDDRTRDRYTGQDALNDRREHEKIEALQDRQIDLLIQRVEKLERNAE